MNLLDVSDRLDEPELSDILAAAIGYPTADKVRSLARRYARDPNWRALALFVDDEPVGVVGFEVIARGYGNLRHIAVTRGSRNRGVGRRLIKGVRDRASLCELSAETDGDAVEFYVRCGFVARSLGRSSTGVERFDCVWRERIAGTPPVGTFGTPGAADVPTADRLAAYAVVTDAAGRILVVAGEPGLFLPGGGREPGEAVAATVIREVREEVGRTVLLDGYLATAIQYFGPAGGAVRMTADFYAGVLADEVSAEGEHEVSWLSLDELSGRMYHQCHEWAARYALGHRPT